MSSIFNPYEVPSPDDFTWLKGNLHCHTTRSDGKHAPQALIDDYKNQGYDFLSVTDHDLVSEPDFLGGLNAGEMTLISGNEITANGPHFCHINCQTKIAPGWRRMDVLNQIKEREPESLVIINHPNWQDDFDHCSAQKLLQYDHYHGIEILNAKTHDGDGDGYALNKWDMCLSAGKRIWGFANDDAHGPGDVGRAWNMVLSENKSTPSLISAMKAGRFYTSTGVNINEITVNGHTITIKSDNAQRIVAIGQSGRRFSHTDGNELTIEFPTHRTRYLRFTLLGEREQSAWTQPFLLED